MDYLELLKWQQYYSEDPFGDQRQDLRFALVGQMIAAMCGAKAKQRDFMLFPEGRVEQLEPMTPEKLSAAMNDVRMWMTHGDNSRKTQSNSDG